MRLQDICQTRDHLVKNDVGGGIEVVTVLACLLLCLGVFTAYVLVVKRRLERALRTVNENAVHLDSAGGGVRTPQVSRSGPSDS